MAHVHVVILGLTSRAQEPALKRLFSYDSLTGDPVESQHPTLTAYLFDGSNLTDRHLVIRERNRPLCEIPQLVIGSKPIDDGNYILNADERVALLRTEPDARRFLRPFIGATEFLYGDKRWILALEQAKPDEIRSMPEVKRRIAAVRAFRAASRSEGTRSLAQTPAKFHVTVIPETTFLVVPKVSSERRDYIPIAWLKPPSVPSDLVFVLLGATLWHFAILTSRMHMSWLRHIGGRLESRYRYSVGVVYNNFPWPEASETQRARVESLADHILTVRAAYPGSSLADLYDIDAMPVDLLRAHQALDLAVDRLYRGAAFQSDRERVEHLFNLYEGLIMPKLAPVIPESSTPRPRRRRSVGRQ
jgi:hypothetical protein